MSNIPFSQQSFSIPPNLNIESITSDIGNFDELFIADLEIEDLELSNLIVNNTATFNSITGDSAEISLVGSQTTATNLLTNNDITSFINVDKDLILTHVGSAINCSNVNSVNANISSTLTSTNINSSGTATLNIADITLLNTDTINPTTINAATATITTGNITTINSTTGNITDIDCDTGIIDSLVSLTADLTTANITTTLSNVIKTDRIYSKTNSSIIIHDDLLAIDDTKYMQFNEYRCRLNTTLPMLFDAVQGLGGIPIKLNTSLPFLANETFVFHGDQMSLESGNNLKINTTGITEINSLNATNADISTLKVNSVNNAGSPINFTDHIAVAPNKRCDAGTIGGNLLQTYNNSGNTIICDANLSFNDGEDLLSKVIYVETIRKHPSSTANRIDIRNSTVNDSITITTQKSGETQRSFYFEGSNFGTGDTDGSAARTLVLNGTAAVRIENLKALEFRSTGTGSIRLFSSITAQADNVFFYSRGFINSSATLELTIATNVPSTTAINLQTRAFGYSINNIRVLGNTLYSTRNGTTPTNIVANPSISNSSDIRLKENIEPLTNGLNLINQLNIKKYQKKAVLNKNILKSCEENECFDGDCYMKHRWLEYGVIAQEVLNTDLSFAVDIPPDLENNPYTLNYNMIYNANLLATQELHKLILDQQAEIIELKKDITQNQKLVNLILSKIDI